MRILTNHIGYDPIGPKQAVIQGKTTDRCEDVRLLDLASGRVIINREPVSSWFGPRLEGLVFLDGRLLLHHRGGHLLPRMQHLPGSNFISPLPDPDPGT